MIKNKTIWILVIIVAIIGIYFYAIKNAPHGLEYENTEYGFTFSMPDSWKNYSVMNTKWQGYSFDLNTQEQINVEQGPIISIHHPLWTEITPRQDIPIMIFTIDQWNKMQKDEFHIGAAPINPSELGRNKKYVFALPARYNYAYLTGFEEVDQIIKTNPLHPF